MDCNIKTRGFMYFHYLSWCFVYWLAVVSRCRANPGAASIKWHTGCYSFSEKESLEIRRFQAQLTTPVNCARICLQEGYNHTGLSAEDMCQCLQDHSLSVANKSDECIFRCAVDDVRLPCGGPDVYSVYASEGPYIKSVRINISSTILYAGLPFRMRVVVTLASPFDVSTGLTEFKATRFDQAEVTVDLGTTRHIHNVQIIGRVGVLEIQHTFKQGGEMQKLGASARNALSSDRHLLLASVVSLRPQGLRVQLTSFYESRPFCTPKSIKDQIPQDANHVTVVVGDRVKLSAVIRQGVNVTFDWNFCSRQLRSSTPHLESEGSCVPAPLKCTIDEQIFHFKTGGTCEVSVNASNHLGSVFSSIYVITVEPTIKDVAVKPAQCVQAKCSSNPWNPPLEFLNFISRRQSYPSSSTGDNSVPSVGGATNNPLNLEPEIYRTGKKVCFHATVKLVFRAGVWARIRFGDHESMAVDLSSPPWDMSMMLGRKKRFVSTTEVPGVADHRGFSSSIYGVNFTNCFTQDCIMNIYFSHVYKKSGFYVVDIQISNSSSYQTSARIDEAVRVIGDAKSTDTLICEALVRTGDLTTMAVRGAKGVVFVWTIDRRDDSANPIVTNEIALSAHWKRLYKKRKPSPLEHTFEGPGVYFVRIIESHRYDIEQEFCLIFVEEEIDDVTVTVQPDVRYVTVGEVLRINVKVGLGSNFTVALSVGNFTNATEGRHNAPYSETFTFVPTRVICQQVHVLILNSVSRADPVSPHQICSEETLSGLTLAAPSELEAGERAEIFVAVQSGSNVEISVEISCFLGSRFQFFKNSTGPTTGPSSFKFKTRSFRRPGIFTVVVLARNHVPTDKRHLVEKATMVVGRRINSLSAQRVSLLNSSFVLNNQNNTVVARVNGMIDNSTGILYKWSYLGLSGQKVSYESASPVFKMNPSCNTSYGDCFVNLTATSGISSDSHMIPILDGGETEHLVEHPVALAVGKPCPVSVNCTARNVSEIGCRVKFADEQGARHVLLNTTIDLIYVFKSPGLWAIEREMVYSNGHSSAFKSYVSVQEKVGLATLQGDTHVYLDASPMGQWRARVRQGTHLIYQWAVKRKNAPTHLVQTSKVSCEREFAYHFTQTGIYDVTLTIHNDVSSMNVSKAVEVDPVYVGEVSVFYLSANLSNSFTLTVKWEETGLAKSFTQDQLFVVDKPTNKTWSQYVLTHLYPTSGQHQYHFTFDWLAGSNIATRDIVNYTTVHDVATNPPYTFLIRHDHEDHETLIEPYHIEVGETVVVDLFVNELTTYLNCLVFYEHKIQRNFSRSFYRQSSRVDNNIRFNVTEPGSYRVRISAKPGNLVTTAHIIAFYHISKLTLFNPVMALKTTKLIERCELKRIDTYYGNPSYACKPVLLRAQSNGHNVTFRFHITNTYLNFSEEIVVGARAEEHSDPQHASNEAKLEYTFVREGAYNITVTAYTVDGHDDVHEVASATTSLPFLFFAESLPSVSLPRSLYIVERGKPIHIELQKNIPEQRLTVNWKMVEAKKVYHNAGYVMDQHSYRYKGRFVVEVIAYNRIGKTKLSFRVMVQERILSVKLNMRTKTFSSNELVRFGATVLPSDSGLRYEWKFTEIKSNLTLSKLAYNKPNISYMFATSGKYFAQVTVINNLNNMTSNKYNFTLLDLIEPFYIEAPEAVVVGKTFSVRSNSYNRNSKLPVANRSWNFGDGQQVLNKSVSVHTYKEPGIYVVTHSVWNTLKNFTQTWKIFVTKAECPLPVATLSVPSSQIVSRSQHLYVEASVDFDCPQVTSLEYRWEVRRRVTTYRYSSVLHNSTDQILHLPPGLLEYGVYQLSLNASLIGTVLFATKNSHVQVEPSALVAVIDGGTARSVSRLDDLIIDASRSYDPDFPQHNNFGFTWRCHVLHSPGQDCFRDPKEGASGRAFQPVAEPMRLQSPEFPDAIPFNQSVLKVPGRYFNTESNTFIFVVNVTKDQRPSSSATFVAKIVEEEVAIVGIRCPKCQKSSINPQKETLVFADCENCHGGFVEYSWTISLVDDGADVIRDESSDCVPPSGKGWRPWVSNSTSNESLSQSDIEEAFRNLTRDSPNTPLHHDENFTGILPAHNYDGRELGQQDDAEDAVPSPVISSSWEDLGEEYPDVPVDQDSFDDSDALYEQYSGLSQLYTPYSSPGEYYPKEQIYPSETPEIQEDIGQTGASEREAQLDEIPSGGRFMIADRVIGFNRERPSGRAPSTSFNGISQLALNAFRNRGRHSPPRATSSGGVSEADKLRSESSLNNLPAHMHYQSYVSEELDLAGMARIPKLTGNKQVESGSVIILRKNKFLEGRTYSIKTNVKHYSDDKTLLKEGSSTYYLHALRGPSMGSCSVVANKNGKPNFNVHCMEWKNVGRKTSDVSMDGSINYEIKYSLGRDGPMRMLYFGTYYERTFPLPESDNEVYVHVTLYNSAGVSTKVCSFPANITSNHTRLHAEVNLNRIHQLAFGNDSQLHHLVLRDDDNAILGLVNVMLDIMPSVSKIRDLATSSAKPAQLLRDITGNMLLALSTIKCLRMSASCDLLETLSRIVEYREFMSEIDVIRAAELLSQSLIASQSLATEEERLIPKWLEVWNQIGDEIDQSGVVNGIMRNAMSALGHMTSFNETIRKKAKHNRYRRSISFRNGVNKHIAVVEERLRDFYLDRVGLKTAVFGPSEVRSHKLHVMVQIVNRSLTFVEETSNRTTVRFPEDVFTSSNESLFQTAVKYISTIPYKSDEEFIEMDNSALSMWIMDEKNKEHPVQNLEKPVLIKLPIRNITTNGTHSYPNKVVQNKLSQHDFYVDEVDRTTWHISFELEETASRPFPIVVALTDHSLSDEAPLNDTQIVTMACLPKRLSRLSHKEGSNHSVKFTLNPGTLLAPGRFYITVFNPDMPKTKLRRRATIPEVPYKLRIWGSDCFYWKSKTNTWDNSGCKVLNTSTFEQTVCSTLHLSTYSSSFKNIETILLMRNFVLMTQATALSPCLTVLIAVVCFFLIFLAVHRFLLRRRDSSSDVDEITGEIKSPGLGSWLRWMFGADDRGASGRVPIVLKDNKPDHKQIFEVTIHTANWPGSGTSSMVYMLMYGLDGKYETRELCTPCDYECDSPGARTPSNSCYFETGSIKTFIVTFEKNQGSLWKICFWHDQSGPRPRWNLDYVIVRDVTTGEVCFFPCDSWLALDHGSNRVSRELRPMESKPTALRHLAMRAKNMILDYHSLVSIMACARWGILTRAQRIVHILSLCMVIFALSSVKTILKESDIYAYDVSCFSGENLLWGFVIGAAASVILLPGQLIFRFTKQDERISVMMEDSTSNTTTSPTTNLSRISLPNKSDHNNGHGGLHKTATVTHNFAELDEILNDEHEMPNNYVTEWLQGKEWASNSRETGNNDVKGPCITYLPGSITSLDTSVSSYDEEIARCMAHDTTASTGPTHTRNTDRENLAIKRLGYGNSDYKYDTRPHSFISTDKTVPPIYLDNNPLHDEIRNAEDSADKPSLFAMDGPELVPCEKLDPIRHTKIGLLPRQCGFLAWTYYVSVSLISALCTVYGAEKYLVDTDFDRWIEASCFALFWTVVVIETLFVSLSTLVATLRNLLSDKSDQKTLEELFPTVDSAQIDDYAYKYYSEYGVASDADTVTDSEMRMRLSERRRSRYLRNISPPYDQKGKWKNKHNPLRTKAKLLRRSEAAKLALLAWCGLLFLSTILVTITLSQDVGNQGRNSHKKHVTDMFRKTFCFPQGYLLSSNCSYDSSLPNFPDISTKGEWRSWFNRSFLKRVENSTATHETSMLLGSIRIALFRRHVATKCEHITQRMKRILNLSECQESVQNHTVVYKQVSQNAYELRNTFHVDILKGSEFSNFSLEGDAVELNALVYNTMTKHYTSLKAFTEFPWGIHPSSNQLQVNSVNLEIANRHTRNALTFCHALLVVWVAWSAVRQFIMLITSRSVSEVQRQEISKRSLLPIHAFMRLLSFSLWLIVVLYLISSTVFRANLLRTADYFSLTGHAGNDYDQFLEAVFTSEIISRQLLAAWTVLVVVQCINFIVTWHGSSSKFTKALTVLCGRATLGGASVCLVFSVLVFILTAVGYLFFGSTLFYHATASKALQQTTSWSVGVATVAAEGKSKLLEAKKRSGIVLGILYFGFVFIVMRVILKGFIVAVYQRKLCRLRKGNAQKSSGKLTGLSQKEAKLNLRKKKAARVKTGISRCVLVGDMLRTAKQEVSNGSKLVLSTIFCGKLPSAFRVIDDENSTVMEQSSSRESLRTISGRKSYDSGNWEKRKLDPLAIGASSHGTTSGFVEGSSWAATTPDEMSVSGSPVYTLSGEIAISEAELQVNELCTRATELIDDAMSNLENDDKIPNLQQLSKTISQTSDKSSTESAISKLSRELAEFVRRHGNFDDEDDDDDEETVVSSTTLSQSVHSNWVFSDDNESERNATISDLNLSHTSSRASLRFGSEALLYSQKHATPSLEVSEKAFADRVKQSPSENSSGSSGDVTEENSQILTAFNLARHDRRLTLLRQKLSRRATAVQQTPVEILSSVSTESKSSVEEPASCESSGGRMNLWQALMRAKHRQKKTAITPVKARPLRRSQTIFVNAKKLPVGELVTPSDVVKRAEKLSDQSSKFPGAFGMTKQLHKEDSSDGVTNICETPERQPDFCEEERTIPGLVPDEVHDVENRATVITKRISLSRKCPVASKFNSSSNT